MHKMISIIKRVTYNNVNSIDYLNTTSIVLNYTTCWSMRNFLE